MPTSASLVTNLPADFNTFGQAVDTSMSELLGGTTGQVLSKTSNTNMDFTWINNDQGDLTAITAGTGISVTSGTGPIPTVALDLSAANVFTAAQTATRFIVTGSTIPTNGVYLPSANSLGFATNSTDAMQIGSTGAVGIGSAASAAFTLFIAKNMTGATVTYGINHNATAQSDVTSTAYGVGARVNTQATAFTLSNLVAFSAIAGTTGAGSTITNAIGFNVPSGFTQGSTLNTGFHGLLAANAAINFNTYMAGTAPNYFAGRVGVGGGVTSAAMVGVINTTAADVGLFVRGAASQTGNLLELQNSASTALAVVNSAGQLTVGNATGTFGTINAISTAGVQISVEQYSSNTAAPGIFGRKARGSVGSPSAISADDQLLALNGRGYGATAFGTTTVAAIIMAAAEAFTDTAQGTYMIFRTTPTGSTTQAERMRLDAVGNLLLGVSTAAATSAKTINIANGTAPTANIAGGILYVESGALKYRGSSGTITTLGAA